MVIFIWPISFNLMERKVMSRNFFNGIEQPPAHE